MAVSGSGAIEAVPLAIFAVSAIVALVSVICLIRLAVSRAGDEKKIDLIKQDRGSQTEVRSSEYNDTNLKNKSNVPTPTPPPVTLGTQQNPSVSVPPPPPPSMPTPEQLNQASVAARENSANTTGEKSPVNAASKSSPPKVPKQCIVSTSSVEESPLYKIMQIIR